MKVDLIHLMERAFMEGFKTSGQGYNGEYPFNYSGSDIEKELSEPCSQSIQAILAEVGVK